MTIQSAKCKTNNAKYTNAVKYKFKPIFDNVNALTIDLLSVAVSTYSWYERYDKEHSIHNQVYNIEG